VKKFQCRKILRRHQEVKKSAKGLLRVERVDGKLVQYDQQTREQEQQGLLEVVFEDGKLLKETSLAEIRQLVREQLDQM
jgi:nicotinamide phosphoribosyltransferase